MPGLLGVSKSTFASYVARGLVPPSIEVGGVRLFVASTVRDWLARSEQAGRLLERGEYLALVAEDAANEATTKRTNTDRQPGRAREIAPV
jgi:hypothetical protein